MDATGFAKFLKHKRKAHFLARFYSLVINCLINQKESAHEPSSGDLCIDQREAID
jgi:hypothetical protein